MQELGEAEAEGEGCVRLQMLSGSLPLRRLAVDGRARRFRPGRVTKGGEEEVVLWQGSEGKVACATWLSGLARPRKTDDVDAVELAPPINISAGKIVLPVPSAYYVIQNPAIMRPKQRAAAGKGESVLAFGEAQLGVPSAPGPGTSLVADTYCSERVVQHPTQPPVDFDCLRNASASSASVKLLAGAASSAADCQALCQKFAYRGLPCRSYTYFELGHRRAAFAGQCFGRVDAVLPSSIDAGATSGVIRRQHCSTDEQCELNGRCLAANGTCSCHPGWIGHWCQTLDLAPAATKNGYQRANFSSWGGSVAFDSQRGLFVMFAAEIAKRCGLNLWYKLSKIVRAVSAHPEGPYVREADVVAYFGHQPTLAKASDGHWLLQGAGGNCSTGLPTFQCTNGSTCHAGACSRPASVSEAGAARRQAQQDSADQLQDCMGNYVMRTLTREISGEWGPQVAADLPDNPSAIVLANGSTLLVGRGFGNSNATGFVSIITLQVGENFTGGAGWRRTATLFPDLPAPGWEDGFAWRRKDGTFHAVFHGMTRQNLTWACKSGRSFPSAIRVLPCPEPNFEPSPWVGRHAWSRDGIVWSYSPYAAWGSAVEYEDGSTRSFARRERPHLILDADGNPLTLLSGVQPGGATADYSYTLAQPTTHGRRMHGRPPESHEPTLKTDDAAPSLVALPLL